VLHRPVELAGLIGNWDDDLSGFMPHTVALPDSKQIQFRQLGGVVCQIRAPFRGSFEEKSSPSP
jgi:hypothetical protein